MTVFQTTADFFVTAFYALFDLLWGDLITIPLPGGSSLGLSLLVLILVPSGIYFTVRTRFLPFRLFPEMLRIVVEKKHVSQKGAISGLQALFVSTATRVGMGNLVGVVAAISAGGAGAVFWMWLIALLCSSTAFAEAVLAQLHKEKDPLKYQRQLPCIFDNNKQCSNKITGCHYRHNNIQHLYRRIFAQHNNRCNDY